MKSRFARGLGALVVGAATAAALEAQPIELLGDLQPDSTDPYVSGAAEIIGAVEGRALLLGYELGTWTLWGSDGTPSGTLEIADLSFSGGAHPMVIPSSPARAYLLVDSVGRVFGGRALRTDGTRAGTWYLRNASGAPLVPFFPSRPTGTAGGGLYFAACATESECGIWFTDGVTPAAQRLVALDLNALWGTSLVTLGGSVYWSRDSQLFTTHPAQPGARLVFGSVGGGIEGLTALQGRLYFVAGTTAGKEAWSSDGTSGGATVLTAFPGSEPFASVSFHATGGRVYFLADDVVHGQELWSTDGSAAGTRRETDFGYHLPFGPQVLGPGIGPEVVGGKLLFGATDGLTGRQLWTTGAGGVPVPLLEPCGPSCSPLSGGIYAEQGRAYFLAADPNHGYEMWSSNGTPAGTRMLVDGCPGSCGSVPSYFDFPQVVEAAGRVFFWTGTDLWVTDGRRAGTHSVYHLDGASFLSQSRPRLVVAVGGRFLFPAVDPTYGEEIFVTDGTPGSAELLSELVGAPGSSFPQSFVGLGEKAVFSAASDPQQGPALWVTDGTPGGTVAIAGTRPRSCDSSGRLCHPLVVVGAQVFFVQTDDLSFPQLWRTDGTPAGTIQLTEGELGAGIDPPGVAMGGKLWFARAGGNGGVELWSSDGTPAGTRAAFTLPEVDAVSSLTGLGTELYFVGSQDFTSNAWRSDGTLAGTRPVTAFPSGSSLFATQFVRAGGAVWFMAGSGHLWRTDGTATGTVEVAHPHLVTEMTSFQGRLYFLAQASPTTRALWRVNDDATGIVHLALFPGTGAGAGIFDLTEHAGHLYFAAEGAGGLELWRSDGTSAGTAIVRDIVPGPEGSGVRDLTSTPAALFFSAEDGARGREPWRTDGTATGTRLVADLWPGPTGSLPTLGAVAGGHFVFGGGDDVVGHEPRSLDLDAPSSCQPAATALCLNAGRFRITAEWKDFAGNRGVGTAVPLTSDTGYFWFFGQENVEAVIKVLDGHALNGHDWVFYGALSNVEYSLTVTEIATGAVRRYFNPSGRFASVGDTQAFGPQAGSGPAPGDPVAPEIRVTTGGSSPCVPAPTRLCLNEGRFAVEATWKDFSGNTGVGRAVVLTGDTGHFWFFAESNVEVVLKVLDGRPVNGKFWVFYGALSSVEYAITVRDTVTGLVRTYHNASGHMASVGDTGAF
jgi:ELWxxDGT repeat protein